MAAALAALAGLLPLVLPLLVAAVLPDLQALVKMAALPQEHKLDMAAAAVVMAAVRLLALLLVHLPEVMAVTVQAVLGMEQEERQAVLALLQRLIVVQAAAAAALLHKALQVL